MMPEALARIHIDQLLQAAGWQVHDLKQANIHTTTGVAIREFPINAGHCVGLGASEFDVLRPLDKVDAKYLYYFVSSQAFRKEAAGHITGAEGLGGVTAGFLADAQLQLVELEEHLLIVAEIEKQFSRLGVPVDNLQRVKANLKRYKASVLKAAVEGRLVETEASIAQREGRSYETGEQLLQRILQERRAKWNCHGTYKVPSAVSLDGLPAVPNGWSCATGGQLFRWSSGVNLPVKNLNGGDVPVYGGNGVNGWHTESNISYPTLVIGRVGAG